MKVSVAVISAIIGVMIIAGFGAIILSTGGYVSGIWAVVLLIAFVACEVGLTVLLIVLCIVQFVSATRKKERPQDGEQIQLLPTLQE